MSRTCPRCHTQRLTDDWQKICRKCYAAEKREELSRAKAEVEHWRSLVFEFQKMLPRLLMLCHPDRHANSDASNTATQWLLEQRARLGRLI